MNGLKGQRSYAWDPHVSFPLLGVDRDMVAAGDAAHGLGLPDLTLTAGRWLRAALHLRPGAPLTLEDDRGLALRLICWRTEYERSSYHLAWPRMTGCAVVIRPDHEHPVVVTRGHTGCCRDVQRDVLRLGSSTAFSLSLPCGVE